ncbi:Caspase domain-containing protein [Mucilaginibacter gossypiicola]|uniref:Caspase domain-containing protein n=1 Tax=Mucilaginibacter gossypiicola TaxID=551995 RepID=A0A1H8Q529_9SPHI|nr:caspase family protein [Mucilaginibacter gossypiicola]SEO49014.1 Caspase domain-containing protein [Mucilaginibacter gossypiicola]
MMKIFKPNILIFFVLVFLLRKEAHSQCSEYEIINLKKIAIVFGEGLYKFNAPLNNTVNDAIDITDSLKKVGFTVYTYQNSDYRTMSDNIDHWFDKIKNYDVALFYFSGHGAEVDGKNYLFPVDINPKGPSDLAYSAYSANKILDRLSNSNLKYSILILDACRNNPFTKSWSRGASNEGLASMAAKGTFIGFAATPGETASDGERRNGAYTEGILKNITVPDLTIDQIFTRVNAYVTTSTGGRQKPFKNSSFISDYCFSVSRKLKFSNDLKKSTFLQPSSEMVISSDEQYLFTVETGTGEINIRDAKTTNIISTLANGVGKLVSLNARDKQWLYYIDSIGHTANVFDVKANKLSMHMKLDYVPSDIIPSIDNKILYISGNNKESGYVSYLDIASNKVTKTRAIKNGVSKMIMSADGKYLYLSPKSLPNGLTIIDARLEKIKMKSSEGFIGKAIGVTPDNQKLYTSNSDDSKINIIDINTFKILNTVVGEATSFAFTKDSKYVFAMSSSKILMISNGNNEIIESLPFVTSPKGLAFSSDGTGFVWLPEEKHVSIFSVKEQTKNRKNEIDPELNLKKFKDEINSDPSFVEKIRKDEFCGKLTTLFNGIYEIGIRTVISSLNYELSKGVKYKIKSDFNFQTDCEKSTGGINIGIVSVNDAKKAIYPNFNLRKLDNEIIITVTDSKMDNATEVFEISLKDEKEFKEQKNRDYAINPLSIPTSDTDIKNMKKFVRDYFSKRLDYLR